MQIVTLIENYAQQGGLLAEHGLSILIDTGSKKILLDTGQTGNFMYNAQVLGIDIMDIDYVVLSHSHYDHTGGLYAFLKVNTKAIIFCKEEIFIPKYNSTNDLIGLAYQDDILKGRVTFIDSVTQLTDTIFLNPQIPLHHSIDTHFENLKVKIIGSLITDEMLDKLFITIRHSHTISILSSYSHRGITNICKTAIDYYKLPIYSIIGGFHIRHCSSEQYDFLVEYLNNIQPSLLGICHCTGIDRFSELKKDLKSEVSYNYVGKRLDFQDT